MNAPRDHHFVPVFYLSQWATGGKLVEFSLKRDKLVSKTVGPKATGYERDLYSFPDLPEEVAQYLESVFLQRNDQEASQALKLLLSGQRTEWTTDIRSSWSRFLLGFLIRHPDPYRELRTAAYQRWLTPTAETQAAYEAIRLPEHPATFEQYLEDMGGGLGDRVRIRLLQSVMDNEPLGQRLNNMIWDTIDLSASSDSLLTSDWPLDKNLPIEDGYISLPISPSHLFVGAYNRRVLQRLRNLPAKKVVHTCNSLAVKRARRFVWARDKKQELFIRKHMSSDLVKPPFFPSISTPAPR